MFHIKFNTRSLIESSYQSAAEEHKEMLNTPPAANREPQENFVAEPEP